MQQGDMMIGIAEDIQTTRIVVAYDPNLKQAMFHESDADEVVYGGAKGGGKSCALVMEGLAYGLEYPGAEMYIFRETYDDLEANIIKEWKEKVPKELYSYHATNHVATLKNGTVMKFRHISCFADAEGYQGRSMDWIGIDELTKHEKRSVQVILSCLRSPKGFPTRFRGTCNPGGIGHSWVKEDYIDATNYGENIVVDEVTEQNRQFIPATVYDNTVLMLNDPNYVKRLENLPDKEKKAFLHGDWDIFEGQYFEEFSRGIHVIEPFEIHGHWQKFRVLDYGLDMLAAYWYTIDPQGIVYFYREVYEPNLIVSKAVERIKDMTPESESIRVTYAPPDLWNRKSDTGKSTFDIFKEFGITLHKSSNSRVDGWMNVKEWLQPYETIHEQTGETITTAKVKIFKNCYNLIRCLPKVQRDDDNPSDVASEPHELTHSVDAFRYGLVMRMRPSKDENQSKEPKKFKKYEDRINSFMNLSRR
jgi:phage terminase large subunit